jgi:hypothetical protein
MDTADVLLCVALRGVAFRWFGRRGNKERDEIEAQFEAEVAALREVEEQAQGDSGAAPATTSVEQAGEEDEEDELAGMTEDELVQQITEEKSAIKMQAACEHSTAQHFSPKQHESRISSESTANSTGMHTQPRILGRQKLSLC